MLIKFSDKPDASFYFNHPTEMLSQKALDRREKYNIEIDFLDVPVSSDYVEIIKDLEIEVIGVSKWFNGIFVKLQESQKESIEQLDFVEEIISFVNHPDAAEITPLPNKLAPQPQTLDYSSTQNQINQINLQALFDEGFTGEGISIAVFDNGFEGVENNIGFSYMFENNKLKETYNFITQSQDVFSEGNHGTRVLSTIAGYIENEFTGTAIDADFYLFVTENNQHELPDEEIHWVLAAEKADSLGVDIINTSLGYFEFDDPRYNYHYQDMDGQTTYISRASQIAFEKGILSVASAGNAGNTDWHYITAPADAEGTFSIGAVNMSNEAAGFSSYGPTSDNRIKPDIAALGVSAAVILNGEISHANGTSFSSPIIAGAMACLLQAFPETDLTYLKQKVKNSAHLFPFSNNQMGFGVPDFGEVYNQLLTTEKFSFKEDLKIWPNPIEDFLFYDTALKVKKIKIVSFEGKILRNYSTETPLNLADLPAGNYFINFQFDNGRKANRKIIKK